jgi:predicted DCC family thiol-disulfide oxidoreductase YuxK
MSSLVLVEDGKVYLRSAGALRIAGQLRFPWNLGYVFIAVPTPLRDVVYRWIARNRYRWFGKRDVCRLPTPEERATFLGD